MIGVDNPLTWSNNLIDTETTFINSEIINNKLMDSYFKINPQSIFTKSNSIDKSFFDIMSTRCGKVYIFEKNDWYYQDNVNFLKKIKLSNYLLMR